MDNVTTAKAGYEEMHDWIAENVMGFEKPFPDFTVIDLAIKCQRPISLISYPGQHRTYWTVVVGDHKVDVETPLEGLCYILWSEGR